MVKKVPNTSGVSGSNNNSSAPSLAAGQENENGRVHSPPAPLLRLCFCSDHLSPGVHRPLRGSLYREPHPEPLPATEEHQNRAEPSASSDSLGQPPRVPNGTLNVHAFPFTPLAERLSSLNVSASEFTPLAGRLSSLNVSAREFTPRFEDPTEEETVSFMLPSTPLNSSAILAPSETGLQHWVVVFRAILIVQRLSTGLFNAANSATAAVSPFESDSGSEHYNTDYYSESYDHPLNPLPEARVNQFQCSKYVGEHGGADGGGAPCSVCYYAFETGESVMTLDCQHQFHEQCTRQLFATTSRCPNCRRCYLDHDHAADGCDR